MITLKWEMTGNGFSGLYIIPKTKYTVPSTHFSIYKDTFSFYKDTKCVKNTLILMPKTVCTSVGIVAM